MCICVCVEVETGKVPDPPPVMTATMPWTLNSVVAERGDAMVIVVLCVCVGLGDGRRELMAFIMSSATAPLSEADCVVHASICGYLY